MKILGLKTQHFHTKLLSQKPMLRQLKWGVQIGPMQMTDFFPVATLYFRKFCFSLGTLYKELIWYINHPNAHIHTSWKSLSFTWGCFFPVNILRGSKARLRVWKALLSILKVRSSASVITWSMLSKSATVLQNS